MKHSVSKQCVPDQSLCSGAPDLVLHCLPMSYKRDARLIWVKVDGSAWMLKLSPWNSMDAYFVCLI